MYIYIHTLVHIYLNTNISTFTHQQIWALDLMVTIYYTHIHIYIYIYIHTYMYMYIHALVYYTHIVYIQIHIYIHTYLHVHVHTHTCTYISKYKHTYIYTPANLSAQSYGGGRIARDCFRYGRHERASKKTQKSACFYKICSTWLLSKKFHFFCIAVFFLFGICTRRNEFHSKV